MKVYVVTDTHLGHAKMVTEFGRPADYEDRLLRNLEKTTGGLFIHCGDICIGHDATHNDRLMDSLRGFNKKILVRGNHDNKSYAWYVDHGWDFVCEEMSMRLFQRELVFTHGPLPMRLRGVYDFNIHGHLHGGGKESHRSAGYLYNESFHLDMAPEKRGYEAINLENLLKEQEKEG